ncbi:phage tail sheath family protein [Bradyrhizobium japonicum]|uniref:phage tail sheath family protein n=1 Tax=Bradyrhizobium japonicum TaxID=375 RepID=UPI00041DA568|nr:phage tail sheath subtilisin-like domain-containing protein [Bradyrhizobium japonicum]WLB91306.1 phage tail sheath subtilisin-like domain-containing protein [Bradyrhizobium japonicum USDA 135]
MAVPLTYPGIYIQEQRSGAPSISGASTSVALFVGMTPRGPFEVPTMVTGYTRYQTQFGVDSSPSELSAQVRQFFLNGGSQAWIIRTAENAKVSQATLKNEALADVLRIEAKEMGAIGDSIRVEVDYDTRHPEETFNLTVYREQVKPNGELERVEVESHTDLSMNTNVARSVEKVLENNSALVKATIVTPVTANPSVSISGAVAANAGAVLTMIQNAVTSAAVPGTFRLWVDDVGPFVIGVPKTIASLAALQNNIINPALVATGTSVTVVTFPFAAARNALMIQSATAGKTIRIESAPGASDIAGKLQLGAANGGLEIGAFAKWRPQPTGLAASLGELDVTVPPQLAPLTALGGADPTKITGVDITTAGTTSAAATAFAGAGPTMFERGGATGLAQLGANLDELVALLNASLTSSTPVRWTAERQGFRIVLHSQDAGALAGLNTTTANHGAGTVDLSAAGIRYLPSTSSNAAAYELGGYGAAHSAFENGTQAGDNGVFPKLARYLTCLDIAKRNTDGFNIMVLPRADNQLDADRDTLWGPVSAIAQACRAFLLVDPHASDPVVSPGTNWKSVANAQAGVIAARAGLAKDYAAMYWPRVKITDETSGNDRMIDPAGTVAGIFARTDAARGVWKAPAGLEAVTVGVRGVEVPMSDDDNGLINPAALNAIRVFTNGIVLWGARTMDGFDNSGDTDYRYIPPRRLALNIEESLYRGIKFALFEPNDEPLWAQIRQSAGAFMNGLFRQGAFQGRTATEAYFVKCDDETTTQTDRNLGVVNVVVGFAALKPAEFIVIVVKQMAGQVQT